MRRGDEEEPLDVEKELELLDRLGTVIDFDVEDKAESAGASQAAIGFFVLAQFLAFVLVGTTFSPAFVLLTAVMNVLYVRLIRSDPGRLPKRDETSSLRSHVEQVTDSIRNQDLRQKLFCRYCRVIRPPRAKHCHKCGCCVAKFDHHCFWLKNCVGSANHRLFLVFLLVVTWWLGWSSAHLVNLLLASRPARVSEPLRPLVIALAVADVGMFFFSMSLCAMHVVVASVNVTTLEFMKPESAPYLQHARNNPFDRGFLGNWHRFCCVSAVLPVTDYACVV
ncbi:putative palmitoyltransferase ZDHHC12 [Diplonema papillatum]|nr:putative palmitoyltransferase ZDHHC12 [Diplonema papillatum]